MGPRAVQGQQVRDLCPLPALCRDEGYENAIPPDVVVWPE